MTRRIRLIALSLLILVGVAWALGIAVKPRHTASARLQATETPPAEEATPAPAESALTPSPILTETPLPSPTYTLYAPTRIPPTPVPQAPTPAAPGRATEPALARIQADNTLRVGAYFNAAPFTWLNERGEVDGYEADIINAIAIELGLDGIGRAHV